MRQLEKGSESRKGFCRCHDWSRRADVLDWWWLKNNKAVQKDVTEIWRALVKMKRIRFRTISLLWVNNNTWWYCLETTVFLAWWLLRNQGIMLEKLLIEAKRQHINETWWCWWLQEAVFWAAKKNVILELYTYCTWQCRLVFTTARRAIRRGTKYKFYLRTSLQASRISLVVCELRENSVLRFPLLTKMYCAVWYLQCSLFITVADQSVLTFWVFIANKIYREFWLGEKQAESLLFDSTLSCT